MSARPDLEAPRMSPHETPPPAIRAIEALLARIPSSEELAQALDAAGPPSSSRRRRLQAELLTRILAQAAELAERSGWNGRAVLAGGKVLVEQDGVLLHAEPGHFRSAAAGVLGGLAGPLERFGIAPRAIVELGAGAGGAAIALARRFPRARVIAVETSPERLDALEANLELQRPPLANIEIVRAAQALDALAASLRLEVIDLLAVGPGMADAALAAAVRRMAGRITAAQLTFDAAGPSELHAELIAALSDAGLATLEKRSRAVDEPEAWLRQRLGERPSLAVSFVARERLKHAERRASGLAALLTDPRQRRALGYDLLDRLHRRARTGNRRFEFERLHALNPDPWDHSSNPYELEKYRRTLEVATALAPGRSRALELGSSIGVFTRLLVRAFDEVTANDVSAEALKLVRRRVGGLGRLHCLRGDIRTLKPGEVYEAIFCAEMLYYMLDVQANAPKVLRTLKRSLAPGGIVMVVMPLDAPGNPSGIAERWRRALAAGLRPVFEEEVPDPLRPYSIRVYTDAAN